MFLCDNILYFTVDVILFTAPTPVKAKKKQESDEDFDDEDYVEEKKPIKKRGNKTSQNKHSTKLTLS